MSSKDNNTLLRVMTELAADLNGLRLDTNQDKTIETLIERNELQKNAATPTWLLQLFSSVRDKKPTGHWVDFSRSEDDDSNVFDFIRELDQVLPIQYENNEESWMLTFPQLKLEACISLEGSCYKISEIGETWNDVHE